MMKSTVYTCFKKIGRGSRRISRVAAMIGTVALAGLTATSAFAAGTPQERIAMSGDEVGMESLAGRWIGEYKSGAGGRHGYISFTLSGEKDRAVGGISMVSGKKGKTGKPGSMMRRRSGGEKRDPLTITFVEIAGGKVSGTVTPFFEPKYNSMVHTVFEGTLYGGELLEGTFTSTIADKGSSYSGTWRVIYSGPAN